MAMLKGYEVNVNQMAKALSKSRPSGNKIARKSVLEAARDFTTGEVMDIFGLRLQEKPSTYMLARTDTGWGVAAKKFRCRTWNIVFECEYENEAREELARLKS